MRHRIGGLLLFVVLAMPAAAQDSLLQFVFTSDVHYGITRPHFRGADSVASTVVSRAMIAAMNSLPGIAVPADGGAGSGERIGHIDGILITGDFANRMEGGVQPATVSWHQFEADYYHLVTTKDRRDKPTPLLLTPGNHDVSNAIGFWRPVKPAKDAGSMAGIYNRMMRPAVPVTAANFRYAIDRIHYIREIGGVRFAFVTCWPGASEQAWMEKELRDVPASAPVLLFTHANPDVEARFFTNPNGDHGVDSADRFENLLPELYQDGTVLKDSTLIEQRGLVKFLQGHPQVKGYFHGHNNYTQFYRWAGPDNTISLPCFRVDSPMKGQYSSQDETQLSFEVITIDMRTRTMTVRECLWNTAPGDASVLKWGQTVTVGL